MKKLIYLALAFVFIAAAVAQQPSSAASVPASRLAHLRHGINITGWFAQVDGIDNYTRQHFESFITREDVAQIKRMGFDHVRLGIDPAPHLFHMNQADAISPEYLGYLDDAVNKVIEQGLAVILEIHAERPFKELFAKDDFVDPFSDFWRALAQHFSRISPELMFFEILNEPEFPQRHRWYGIQARVAAAIRDGAPAHTIIVMGDQDASIEGLLALEPLRDANVIYSFHYYDPHIFTHQGAEWGANFSHFLKGVSYPSDPESAKKAAVLIPVSDALDRFYVTRYGMEHWNADRIESEINQVAEWARRLGVPVICDEFGVYKKTAASRDRYTWIRDVRRALEKHGIGWTAWDYSSDGFGVVSRKQGRITPDDAELAALGLR